MAESEVFDVVCELLEGLTVLDRLEARGTVRIALKASGLEPRSVTAEQMSVVVTRVLVKELLDRGIDDGEAQCRAIDEQLDLLESGPTVDTPEAVFERLGR